MNLSSLSRKAVTTTPATTEPGVSRNGMTVRSGVKAGPIAYDAPSYRGLALPSYRLDVYDFARNYTA